MPAEKSHPRGYFLRVPIQWNLTSRERERERERLDRGISRFIAAFTRPSLWQTSEILLIVSKRIYILNSASVQFRNILPLSSVCINNSQILSVYVGSL